MLPEEEFLKSNSVKHQGKKNAVPTSGAGVRTARTRQRLRKCTHTHSPARNEHTNAGHSFVDLDN